MFERYTEKARRVIFFARYEASQFGSPCIETEHLLLGLLREDTALARRFLRAGAPDSIRKQIEASTEVREKTSTSADLPLSNEGQRVLAYSAEEAERLNQKHIGTEHLLLGLLREEQCFAAQLLKESGLALEGVRSDLALNPHETPWRDPVRIASGPSPAEAEHNYLIPIKPSHPLVGRERELGWVLQVLGRRYSRNPVLVGEPGVGKQAIVSGLTERIRDGAVPPYLSDATLVQLDLPPWAAINRAEFESLYDALLKAADCGAILVVDELHMMDGAPGGNSVHLQEILKRPVVSGYLQVLSIATPANFARSIAEHGWLDSCFQAVRVPPATHEETLEVLRSLKSEFEDFHAVTYLDAAMESCIPCAAALPGRRLPGSAVDVMDEAGTLVKLRSGNPPEEVADIQKRLQFIVHRMQAAILNREFEKAGFYSDEERKERDNLRLMSEKLKASGQKVVPEVTREDVERVISHWTGMTLEGVQKMLNKPRDGGLAK